MKFNQSVHLPAVEGYIYVELDSDREPAFKVTHTFHEQPLVQQRPDLVPHPVNEKLRGANSLRSIPVRVLFDTPHLNITGRYEAWSELCPTGPVCVGDGEHAKVYDGASGAWGSMPCRGPGLCPRAALNDVTCSFSARMQVEIADESVEDKTFEFRTNSVNTYKAVIGALQKQFALHGALRHINFNLLGWVKSSPASNYESFACALIEPAGNMRSKSDINSGWEEYGQRCAQFLLDECYPTEMEKMSLQGLVLKPLTVSSSPERKQQKTAHCESPFAIVMQQARGNQGESKTQ